MLPDPLAMRVVSRLAVVARFVGVMEIIVISMLAATIMHHHGYCPACYLVEHGHIQLKAE